VKAAAVGTIDYYFWTSSDWAYFGNPRLKAMAEKHGLTVNYFPVDLATVYARTGGIKLALRSQERKSYRLEEMRRFSKLLQMPVITRPTYPIINNDWSSRVIVAAKSEGIHVHDLTHAIMGARWAEDKDIEDKRVLVDIMSGLGLNADALWEIAERDETGKTYELYTEQAIARGVFGSPFYFFGEESFWGQDRLEHLQRSVIESGL